VVASSSSKFKNLFYLHQKPAVNLREVENLLDAEAGAQGVAQIGFHGQRLRLVQ
jgi:hypothetical protein